ncbi:hypothetical protein Cgig2_007165 [Carnegiea gigantea]|uniref:Uncharacterized protein n=1 Tax=Carnegiea gigantea TaxID=171969 RepID=A0A9Q1JSD4_9CARY|nr:hypothetical protein Cgig2_007165 [Carnegiea gigantea]
MVFLPLRSTEEMDDHVRKTFEWHLRGASRLPRLLPGNHHEMSPGFVLSDVEEAAHDFDIPEMIHATFYAMVVNDALELGVMSRDMAGALKSALKGLRWLNFEYWLRINKHALIGAQYRRHVSFEAEVGPASSREEDLELSDASLLFREHKKILCTVPIYELSTPSWSSYEYSSTPRILNVEEDVVYPWEIDVVVSHITDVQERRMAMIKTVKTPEELMDEGYSKVLAPPQGGTSSSSSSHSLTPRSKWGRAQEEPVCEVVAEGTVFPGASERSDLQGGPSSQFPNPKVVATLKRPTLEEKHLPSTGYTFIILDANDTVNRLPSKCIVIYRAAFSYEVWFPLHPIIMEILNKCELAPHR